MKSNLMPRPKKVHFSDAVEYHYVKCLDDYTVIERSQIWLTAKDYSRIRLENKVIIDMIDEGLVEEDRQETCYRGLETKATEECKYRRNQKQEAKEAVLYAQEAQHDERQMQLDWEPIREAYISMSSESKTLAEEVGLSDGKKKAQDFCTFMFDVKLTDKLFHHQ
jgi:hypothetical protein